MSTCQFNSQFIAISSILQYKKLKINHKDLLIKIFSILTIYCKLINIKATLYCIVKIRVKHRDELQVLLT